MNLITVLPYCCLESDNIFEIYLIFEHIIGQSKKKQESEKENENTNYQK